ncbi:MAG TPA: polysaccharide deacetylase family protein [Burkholderiales bacterium]
MRGLANDRILMYHGTPAADGAALERQLRCVSLAFPVVPLDALAQRRRSGTRARVALTFDDGLRSNVEVAYPILRKLGLTATFFVCPGLIDRGEWLWNHEARQRLLSLPKEEVGELAAHVGAPEEVEGFIEWMKTLPLAERRQVEARIREATPRFSPTGEQRAQFDLAPWAELKKLDPQVVTIGSHTLTHPILTSLTAEETEAEMRESRFALERRLERAVTQFCYPNGNLNDAALESARRHYRSAVTVDPGFLDDAADAHQLPRFAAHPRGMKRLVRRMIFG